MATAPVCLSKELTMSDRILVMGQRAYKAALWLVIS